MRKLFLVIMRIISMHAAFVIIFCILHYVAGNGSILTDMYVFHLYQDSYVFWFITFPMAYFQVLEEENLPV